ncbi:hypothetical protein K227x_53150 [Rubripirellula lacrimiformis]|uniref:Uncharacterized protein n=1 Tax=Rubripirellula lacrimiformis TaxID=1930273 RepID=A0A517NID8_9BACT|nr:hypothetical protein K227x_53150 [Rubripirellula lacrimiformis]
MTDHYPKRSSHWAHKLTRLLFKSCAAQDIGHHAVCLVTHIAHTEDAARYQGPVRFWNSQLMEVLGFNSPKQLTAARDKAIQAGWLVYHRVNDRSVGNYWTEMPDSVSRFSDEPIEESCSDNGTGKHSENGKHSDSENGKHSDSGKGMHSESGTHGGTHSGMHCGTHSGMHCGTHSGKPSYPTPNPTPNPKNAAKKSPDYSDAFEEFWKAYPANSKGRKRGKSETFKLWRAVPVDDHDSLLVAARNYAADEGGSEYVRDPERFLKKDWWRDLVGPPERQPSGDEASLPSSPVSSIADRRRQIEAERTGVTSHA